MRRTKPSVPVPRSRSATATGLRRDLVDAVGILLAQARSALFIVGSGLTTDAGLPVYRGIPGLRRKKTDDGKLFDVALAVDTLAAEPETTWRQLIEIEAAVSAARPSPGHHVLAHLERSIERMLVVTTSVDRLHQRAGSRNVIEMHGALYDLLCKQCEMSSRHDSFATIPVPPRCAVCRTVLRPDMTLFGEPLPVDPFTRLQGEIEQGFDMVFAIGIRTMHSYLARPVLLAKAEGIPTIEIGPQHTDLSDVVDFRFRGSSSRVLELIGEVYDRVGRLSQENLGGER